MYAGSFKHTTILSLPLCKVTVDKHIYVYVHRKKKKNNFKCILKIRKMLLRHLKIVSGMKMFFLLKEVLAQLSSVPYGLT